MQSASTLKFRAWVAVSVLVALVMLPNIVLMCVGYEVSVWISGILIPALLLTALFAIFGKNIWLACIALSPFALLAPAEAIYIAAYQQTTNAEIIATIFATTPQEAYDYLGSSLIPASACVVASLLLTIVTVIWTKRAALQWTHQSRRWVIASTAILIVVGAITILSMPARLKGGARMAAELYALTEPGYPFGLLPRIEKYRSEWKLVRENVYRLDAFRFGAHRLTTTKKRQVYVLVIGESSRRDHWQLFGYQRATNPMLERVANLIKIPNMLSSWSVTIMAVPQILTRRPITDTGTTWKEASVLRAMQEAGFDTWWISNQFPVGEFDSPVSTYSLEANHTLFLNHASMTSAGSYDEVLLQPLRDVLKKSNKDLFVVLHMMGSHDAYDKRYPPKFKHFKPTFDDKNSGLSSGERQPNSYDNSVLYTDYVLSQAITILREQNAITALFYVSDHGEALATPVCSKTGHGEGTRYEFEVPGLFWYSNTYAEAFPDRLAEFRANANKATLSADTFESLLDMTGVDFPGLDHQKSLFSAKWRYEPRIVNPVWQVDFDKAVFSKKCAIVLPPGADTENH
jgi:glucan phosphoethanolaminetransferase (alkaline phosphatase superfamily)